MMYGPKAIVWGAIGSLVFLAIGLKSLCESPESFWGRIVVTLGAPALYMGGFLSSALFGSVEGPIAFHQAIYYSYMVLLGFFAGFLLSKLPLYRKKKRRD